MFPIFLPVLPPAPVLKELVIVLYIKLSEEIKINGQDQIREEWHGELGVVWFLLLWNLILSNTWTLNNVTSFQPTCMSFLRIELEYMEMSFTFVQSHVEQLMTERERVLLLGMFMYDSWKWLSWNVYWGGLFASESEALLNWIWISISVGKSCQQECGFSQFYGCYTSQTVFTIDKRSWLLSKWRVTVLFSRWKLYEG